MNLFPSFKKSSVKTFPIFGHINNLILNIKPRVKVGKKLTFVLDIDSLKEVFKLYGLDPNKYTIFDKDELSIDEIVVLLVHLCQTHEQTLIILQQEINKLKEKIK